MRSGERCGKVSGSVGGRGPRPLWACSSKRAWATPAHNSRMISQTSGERAEVAAWYECSGPCEEADFAGGAGCLAAFPRVVPLAGKRDAPVGSWGSMGGTVRPASGTPALNAAEVCHAGDHRPLVRDRHAAVHHLPDQRDGGDRRRQPGDDRLPRGDVARQARPAHPLRTSTTSPRCPSSSTPCTTAPATAPRFTVRLTLWTASSPTCSTTASTPTSSTSPPSALPT